GVVRELERHHRRLAVHRVAGVIVGHRRRSGRGSLDQQCERQEQRHRTTPHRATGTDGEPRRGAGPDSEGRPKGNP
ncbi:MAG: hypothetical protein ACK55I_20005, partial [bacterium]